MQGQRKAPAYDVPAGPNDGWGDEVMSGVYLQHGRSRDGSLPASLFSQPGKTVEGAEPVMDLQRVYAAIGEGEELIGRLETSNNELEAYLCGAFDSSGDDDADVDDDDSPDDGPGGDAGSDDDDDDDGMCMGSLSCAARPKKTDDAKKPRRKHRDPAAETDAWTRVSDDDDATAKREKKKKRGGLDDVAPEDVEILDAIRENRALIKAKRRDIQMLRNLVPMHRCGREAHTKSAAEVDADADAPVDAAPAEAPATDASQPRVLASNQVAL